jgi:hypothetical protein
MPEEMYVYVYPNVCELCMRRATCRAKNCEAKLNFKYTKKSRTTLYIFKCFLFNVRLYVFDDPISWKMAWSVDCASTRFEMNVCANDIRGI